MPKVPSLLFDIEARACLEPAPLRLRAPWLCCVGTWVVLRGVGSLCSEWGWRWHARVLTGCLRLCSLRTAMAKPKQRREGWRRCSGASSSWAAPGQTASSRCVPCAEHALSVHDPTSGSAV